MPPPEAFAHSDHPQRHERCGCSTDERSRDATRSRAREVSDNNQRGQIKASHQEDLLPCHSILRITLEFGWRAATYNVDSIFKLRDAPRRLLPDLLYGVLGMAGLSSLNLVCETWGLWDRQPIFAHALQVQFDCLTHALSQRSHHEFDRLIRLLKAYLQFARSAAVALIRNNKLPGSLSILSQFVTDTLASAFNKLSMIRSGM